MQVCSQGKSPRGVPGLRLRVALSLSTGTRTKAYEDDSCVVHACRTLALNVHQLLHGYQVPYTHSSVCCEGSVRIASMHSAVGHHQIIHHSMSTCLRPKPLFALPRPNDVTGSRYEPGRHRPGTRCRVSTSAVRYKL